MILDLLGMPTEEHAQIKEWADHGVALLAGINTPEEFAGHVQVIRQCLVHDSTRQYTTVHGCACP
jgi:hypothetical protein